MLKTYLQYSEGGNIYKDNARINKDEVPEILEKVKYVLKTIGINNYQQIGSAGIKETSGDIDILVDTKELSNKEDIDDAIKDAAEKLLEKLKKEFVHLHPIYTKGLGEVSLLVPIRNKLVQVDLILSNFEWGKQYHKREFLNTKYSATDRGIAIAELVKTLTNKKIIEGTPEQPITWEELIVSPNKGIMLVTKTFKNEAGKILKTARTLTKKQITKNFADIAKMVKAKYKIDVPENTFDSFENIMSLIDKTGNKELKDKINKQVKSVNEEYLTEAHKIREKSSKESTRENAKFFETALAYSLENNKPLSTTNANLKTVAIHANIIAQRITKNPATVVHLGGKKINTSDFWQLYTNKKKDTSKTDIIVGKKQISVKYGPALLMSGAPKEAIATLLAAADTLNPDIQKKIKQFINVLKRLDQDVLKSPSINEIMKKEELQKKYRSVYNQILELKTTQKQLKNGLIELSKKSPDLKRNMIQEALSGSYKFGGADESGIANYILSVSVKDDSFKFETLTNKEYAAKILDKVTIDISFKTAGHTDVIDGIKFYAPKSTLFLADDVTHQYSSFFFETFLNEFDITNEEHIKSLVSNEERKNIYNEEGILLQGLKKLWNYLEKIIYWLISIVHQGVDAILEKVFGLQVKISPNAQSLEFPTR